MVAIFFTLPVSKLLKSMLARFGQSLNIFSIVVTLEVFRLFKSRLSNDSHSINIISVLVIWFPLLNNLIVLAPQSRNIPYAFFSLGILKLLKSIVSKEEHPVKTTRADVTSLVSKYWSPSMVVNADIEKNQRVILLNFALTNEGSNFTFSTTFFILSSKPLRPHPALSLSINSNLYVPGLELMFPSS